MTILRDGSRGPLVSFLQITLKNLNLYSGEIDGIFGPNTLNSVRTFQRNNNITPDGIVGDTTWNALLEYMEIPTTIPYTYDILMLNIMSILSKYNFISSGSIGDSVMDKSIPYLKLGEGPKQLLYVARNSR
ncbi:MAG: peptidoglycan-binding protein [Clostridia bacterium]|nr:peptidoglycan-binding protein [Clostridia bacterium]